MRLLKKILIILWLVVGGVACAQSASFERPDLWWRCVSGNALINNNPAHIGMLSFDSIPFVNDYTVIVVYRPIVDVESTVWQLGVGDSVCRALTTERMLIGGTSIGYVDATGGYAAINTLRQSLDDSVAQYLHLQVGDSNLKVAEVMFYGRRIGHSTLRRIQSALAVRYGITLGPVDYSLDGVDKIWHHGVDSGLYHHRIIGVGVDTMYGVCQYRSHSEMDDSMLTVVCRDSLSMGDFVMIGDNGGAVSFVSETFGSMGVDGEVLAREWQVQSNVEGAVGVDLAFATRNMEGSTDSLVLMVGDRLVLPTVVTSNEVRFEDVSFVDSITLFTLARGSVLWNMASASTMSFARQGVPNGGEESFKLYPNPTTGNYTLDVEGAQEVEVVIYDVHGVRVAAYSGRDKENYRFQGTLPSGNAYFATITTEQGTQTLRLIVK